MYLESLDQYLPTEFVMDERIRAQRTPNVHVHFRAKRTRRALFRTVKILRMKCLVDWPNVSQSRNQVIVDVVQKFYFLMFTGICIIIICVCQQQNNKSDKQGVFNCWLLQ